MSAPAWEYRLQRFTSDDWPAKARLESWRELLSRKMMHSAVTEMDDAPFRVKAAMRELPGIRFGWGSFSPTRHERTREIVARDNDDFFFIMNLEGRFITTQSRREVSLEPGEATLLACAEIGTYVRPDAGKFMCLRVPCVALTGLVPDAYDRIARVMPRDIEALELLTSYSSALNLRQALVTPELRKLAVTHLYDLMALSLGASRDGTAEASVRGLGAARFRAIKTYIAGNLPRQTLSVADVAQQHRLSPRQAQRLFEAAGTTFSEYVQRERLSLVYLALTDPSSAAKGIGDIVLDCGFGDLSHFNRAFRRRYGTSPSEVRQYEMERRR